MDEIVVGIDVGTTKICTLVGRIEEEVIRIMGVGIEPSAGIKRGVIVDLPAASQAIAKSVKLAEQTSGVEITGAVVSLGGAQVSSINSRGVAGITEEIIDELDVARALEAARAVAIPHNREIIHVIQRGFTVDGHDGIAMPIGMRGYRLEVEAHIITAAQATVENLRQSVNAAGVEVIQFVLNPLAAGDLVLTDSERQMGVAICDIGGGTTDLALYVNGNVWHTMVLAVGGDHLTNDIATGLRLPLTKAEEIKKKYGFAFISGVGAEETFSVHTFGEDQPVKISRQDMAHIIEARLEEIFTLILQEIKRSGYDGLLPAGMVLTGGTSALPGIRQLASQVFGLPIRTAQPEKLVGLVDQLKGPAFSTSVGLLHWAANLTEDDLSSPHRHGLHSGKGKSLLDVDLAQVKDWFKRLLPTDD
jgi:cell division protein FtsA